jgi:hypothetical protein
MLDFHPQGSGCQLVKGLELQILQDIDAMYNMCLWRGGWRIKVVVPMSKAPIEITTGSSADQSLPDPAMGYPEGCVVVPTAHPKVLLGNQQGSFSREERQQLASETLLDIMRAFAYFRGADRHNLQERSLQLYGEAVKHPTFAGHVWSLAEMTAGQADPFKGQERATALASRNGRGGRR